MRSFLPEIIERISRRDGQAPVWILSFTAAGTDYILCQDAVAITPWSKTALPWIESWGQMTQGVTGLMTDFNISDLSVNLINDPLASPNMRSLAKGRHLNGIMVSVYFWFDGATAAPVEMERYRVRDITLPTESQVVVNLQDESARYESYTPGSVVTRENYPGVDPDDIGKIEPIVFGSVRRLPTLAIDAGIRTTISVGMTAAQTTMVVSDPSGFWVGMWAGIDDETMLVTGISGSSISITRGHDSTLPTSHQRGADLIEIRPNDFAYLVAAHPVSSVNRIWARLGNKLMDVSAIATIYTGQPGNEYPTLPGKSVVTVPGFITVSQAADLMIYDGISVDDQLQVFDGIGVSDTIAVSDTIGISDAIAVGDNINVADGIGVYGGTVTDGGHGHSATQTTSGILTGLPLLAANPISLVEIGVTTSAFGAPPAGTSQVIYEVAVETEFMKELRVYVPGGSYIKNTVNGSTYYNINGTIYVAGSNTLGGSVTVNIWNDTRPTGMLVRVLSVKRTVVSPAATSSNGAALANTPAAKSGTVTKTGGALRSGAVSKTGTAVKSGLATKEGTVTRAGWVAKTGTVSIVGNSVANTLIGDAVLVDVVSPITTPQAVISYLHGGITCDVVGTWPIEYTLSGAITSPRRLLEWCHLIARQCRSFFRYRLQTPTLIVRPDVPQSVHTVSEIRLAGGEMVHSQKLTDMSDVINTINLRYDRDWSQDANGDEQYQQVASGSDSASVGVYGVKERPELFRFDFVTAPAIASDLLQFYLKIQSWQRWKHVLECYLSEASLEFADTVTMGFAGNEIGQVAEVGFYPGSGNSISKIQLSVIE